MLNDEKKAFLESVAHKMRKHIVRMIYDAGSGHPGGSLSATEIISTLYFHSMKHDPKNPSMADRDRLVLSKGHCAPALYSALALSGYFPESDLITLRKIDSYLQGHPSMRNIPGIDMSTGSLGQGLSIGTGMAKGCRLDGIKNNIYVIMGDGEMQSGNIWEGAMAAAHFKADNIIAILDKNLYQIDGSTSQIMTIDPIEDKWKSFGWNVYKANGHDVSDIAKNIDKCKNNYGKGKPNIIIADTVKGRGVSYMENTAAFHGKPPSRKEYEIAMEELR